MESCPSKARRNPVHSRLARVGFTGAEAGEERGGGLHEQRPSGVQHKDDDDPPRAREGPQPQARELGSISSEISQEEREAKEGAGGGCIRRFTSEAWPFFSQGRGIPLLWREFWASRFESVGDLEVDSCGVGDMLVLGGRRKGLRIPWSTRM